MKRKISTVYNAARQLLLMMGLVFTSVITCSAVSTTSKGTDFWVMFNGNNNTSPTLTIFITSTVNTSGVVSSGAFANIPFTVTANAVTAISIPAALSVHTSDVADNKGIHIVSQHDVTVYGLNQISATTDAYLGLPTDVLGTDYMIMNYKNTGVVNGNSMGIVATENGTTVTITPATTAGSRTAGVPYTINLNQGQSYELIATTSSSDLTGTTVISNKKIGVFGASKCANIPQGVTACDHICEMLPPTTTWGKKFGAVPLRGRNNGDTWRFLASENGTVVTINGVAQTPTLNKGQFLEKSITARSTIESNKPILAAQFANGASLSGQPGDPFMMLIPPLEQFVANYTVTNVAGFTSHSINIIAPNAIVGNIIMDGTPISPSLFVAIGTTGYSGAQVPSTLGSHNLSSTQPFGVFAYGFNSSDSYGYPGGQSFAPIATISNIAINPTSGSAFINTQQCFTATVTDQFNAPVVGAVVNFNITGANPGSTGFGTTDANGVATFCYAGANAGNDNIVASVGTLSAAATFTWSSCLITVNNCPDNITVFTGAGNTACSQTATWTAPTATSNCPGTATVASHQPGSTFNVGITPVTYTFSNTGVTQTCTFNVTVIDNTLPTITAPAAVSVSADAGSCEAVNVVLGAPVFSDNCSGATVINDAPASFPIGNTVVTYIVTDAVGLQAIATQIVTVTDNEMPTLGGVPADATASCNVVPAPANVTATDNCGTPAMASFTYPVVNAKTIHLWKGENNANDEMGTANAAVQFGSINYGTGISNNSFLFDGGTGLNADVAGSVSGTGDFSVSAWIRTTSNGGMTVIQQRDQDINGQYILKIGTNHNGGAFVPGKVYFLVGGAPGFSEIFGATNVNDGKWHHVAGERTGSTINIYVDGVLDASTSTPGTINMNANNAIRTFIGYDQRNVDFGVDPNFFLGDIDEVRVMSAANCSANHDVNYAWKATDAANNTTIAIQTVAISDANGPTLTVPADITVSNDAGVCGAAVNFTATATDLCSSVGNLTYTQQPGSVFNVGTTTVNITATDACGNSSNGAFNVTVNDTEHPTVTAPAAVSVSADAGSCSAANVVLGTPVYGDNCAGATIISNAPATFPIGNTIVTYTVTDAGGLQATATQIVTVTDDEDPTIAAPADVTVSTDAGQCSASNVVLGSATFGDNCSGAIVTNNAPAVFPKGSTIVTYIVTDAAGNQATATQIVTVTDDEDPTVAAPAAVSVTADAGQCSASNVALGIATFGDNCPGSSVSNDAPAIFPVGNTTVTYTATDAVGNTATATQVVTVTDNQNPTLTAPAAVSVNADAGQCSANNVTLGNANAADNCGTVTITNNAPASFPVGATTVTYTAIDAHGNSATATQLVTVTDNQNPSVIAPANITIPGWCANVPGGSVDLGTPITSDNCGVASVVKNNPASYPVGVTTITWTVTDINGNVSTATQTVTVTNITLTATSSVNPLFPFPGQELQTIYLNYPSSAQSVTIGATPTNGTAPYTYSWQRSGCNNTLLAPLTNTLPSYSFAPTQSLICKSDSDNVFKFVVTVTDAHGCATTQTRNINVVDPYVGNKIKICHRPPGYPENSHILSVGAGAVPAHLDHGDNLGNCFNFNGKSLESEEAEQEQAMKTIAESLKFNVYPNPTTGNVIIELPKTGNVSVMIVDVAGKVVVKQVIQDNTQQQLQYNLSNEAKGMYFIHVINAGENYQTKLILQ
jgi:hypothetical protein